MQVGILNGIYVDAAPDMRSSYPRNLIPVAKQNGISAGYLKPADGVQAWGPGGPGIGRGGINWSGTLYRVMGNHLCRVTDAGNAFSLGYIGGSGQVTMDYGFDRLAVIAGGHLYYLVGGTLSRVTDPDLGRVIDGKWMAGYFVLTDGASIIVTDLNDPTSINPLKYGSSESDPDPVKAVDELRNELYAFNRYTIEVFENVGGDLFPFKVVQGAVVPKGIIGTYTYCSIGDTFVFLGSGHKEAPGVYMMVPGNTQKLSTREIDQILTDYSEEQLAAATMEALVLNNQQLVLLHLPDRCLAYDTIGSKLLGESVWFTLDSGVLTPARYRARNFVWCYDRWCCEDPTSHAQGQFTETTSTHYGQKIGWDFGTPMFYNAGNDAIVLEIELVALPGRGVALGQDPQVWTSQSVDGETWSPERGTAAGKQGERARRVAWRNCGCIRNYRMQKFRGTSDAHLPVVRLEVKAEPLATRPGRG